MVGSPPTTSLIDAGCQGTVQNALFVSPTVNTSTSQGSITLHRASRHRTVIARQGGTGGEPRWRSRTDAADADVVNIARRRLQKGSVLPVAPKEPAGGMDDFVRKLKAAVSQVSASPHFISSCRFPSTLELVLLLPSFVKCVPTYCTCSGASSFRKQPRRSHQETMLRKDFV